MCYVKSERRGSAFGALREYRVEGRTSDFWQDLADSEYLLDNPSWRERLSAILAANPGLLDASAAELQGSRTTSTSRPRCSYS